MDIIYADSLMQEMGLVRNFSRYDAVSALRTADSSADCDWQLDISAEDFTRMGIGIGWYIYVPGSEWGGPVEKIKHISSNATVQLSGATWRGMLARAAIEPPSGETHLVISDIDAHEAIAQLLSDRFGSLIVASEDTCGTLVSGKFRYVNLLEAIENMLEEASLRLAISLDTDTRRIILSAQPVTDHSDEIEFSQDYDVVMTSEINDSGINHIIALGQGEGTARTVLNVWRLPDGTITTDSSAEGIPVGISLRSDVYDYSSAEDADALLNGAVQRLKAAAPSASISIDLDGADIDLPLGDIVAIRDRVTGLSATRRITQKILSVTANAETISHKTS